MPTKVYLEASDASQIEGAAQCLRDQLLIRLYRRLGARASEVLGLEEKHIDFTQRQIRIEHEKMRINLSCPSCGSRLGKKHTFCPLCGEPVKQVVKKAKEERHLRTLPVDEDTLKLIRRYIKQDGITEVNGKRMLFNISRQRAWKIVVDCAERAGFTMLVNQKNDKQHHVSPHKFRDAFAINAMKKKSSFDDARLLQEMLGHANISTTMNYRKVDGKELKQFYDDLIEAGDK